MKRTLALAIALTIVTGHDAGAESLLAPKQTIVRVDDYTTPGWSATVIESVNELNAVLPDTVTLEYHGIPEIPCEDIAPAANTIALCSTAEEIAVAAHEARDGVGGTMAGTTQPSVTGAGEWFMLITLADENLTLAPEAFNNNTVGHELIHALTTVQDCYEADLDGSMVWGYLTEPGSTDIMWLAHVWETATPAWMTGETCP